MPDLHSLYDAHKDLSDADAIAAGKAQAGSMGDEHTAFVKLVAELIKSGAIDAKTPATFLHSSVYESLSEEAKAKVDQATVNIADLLRHVADFYMSKETPDASPQLQNMIEQLWVMKKRVEDAYGDVFKF